jgi:protein-tyrosine phosphatase
MPASIDHSLPLNKIVNARDLGGYVTEDGRRVKKGLLIRCAHLAHASQADLDFLAGLPVTRVVDFRLDFEKNGKEDQVIPGATYVSIPVDASGPIAAQATEEERKKFTGRKSFDVKKVIVIAAFNDKAKKMVDLMYPTLVNDPDCQWQYATFLRLLVDNEAGAVLFHCTQGKDRAGMAAAFILAALGAGRDTIIADFDETNRHYAQDLKKFSRRVRFWGGKEEELAVVKAFIGANSENFIKTLDLIDDRYGSMESYLKGPLKLSDTDLQTLRERFLEA